MSYVIVTGCNGGLGQVVTTYLLNSGYQVIGIDINECNIINPKFIFFKIDLSDIDNLNIVKEYILQNNIELFGIINLVGIFIMDSVIEGDPEKLKKIINVNFFGQYNVNKTLFTFIEPKGIIINMSSEVAGYSPQPFMLNYSMTKKMIDSYTDVLRREAMYLGIRVVKIRSGSLNTLMLPSASKSYEELLSKTKYYSKPLTKMKFMMDKELKKTHDPLKLAIKISKILVKKHPKVCYKYKLSLGLRLLNLLPEKIQDKIYYKVIK